MPPRAQAQQDFSGESIAELLDWLEASNIDTSSYGSAASKSVDLLWQEVQDGETVLTVAEGGRALRLVNVVRSCCCRCVCHLPSLLASILGCLLHMGCVSQASST